MLKGTPSKLRVTSRRPYTVLEVAQLEHCRSSVCVIVTSPITVGSALRLTHRFYSRSYWRGVGFCRHHGYHRTFLCTDNPPKPPLKFTHNIRKTAPTNVPIKHSSIASIASIKPGRWRRVIDQNNVSDIYTPVQPGTVAG